MENQSYSFFASPDYSGLSGELNANADAIDSGLFNLNETAVNYTVDSGALQDLQPLTKRPKLGKNSWLIWLEETSFALRKKKKVPDADSSALAGS